MTNGYMNFIPYVCCGDPSIEFTEKLIRTLAPHSDIIELGIPFSDPIADGKTIQAAANRALANGVTVEKIFGMVERLRANGTDGNVVVPLVFMTYFNIVYAYGREKFLKRMKEAGVQGLIIPDLPFGEDLEFESLAKSHGISIINLIAPNTTDERAKQILEKSRNTNALFTYLVSNAGTTGTRDSVSLESIEFVKRIRMLAGNGNINRLCVGFGISTKEQADAYIKAGADGVIVGSRIIELYSKHTKPEDTLKEIENFARGFKNPSKPN